MEKCGSTNCISSIERNIIFVSSDTVDDAITSVRGKEIDRKEADMRNRLEDHIQYYDKKIQIRENVGLTGPYQKIQKKCFLFDSICFFWDRHFKSRALNVKSEANSTKTGSFASYFLGDGFCWICKTSLSLRVRNAIKIAIGGTKTTDV